MEPDAPLSTEDELAAQLRDLGALSVREVVFKDNGSTFLSLRRGRLHLHRAFTHAPDSILRALAIYLTGSGRQAHRALAALQSWPMLQAALEESRSRRMLARAREAGAHHETLPVAPCSATPAQRRFLRRLYRILNEMRFGDRLPSEIPLRFSKRMASRLGHCSYAEEAGVRRVTEIALNIDLLLPGNDAHLEDTMLHEMAHGLAWIEQGERGHGPAWRRIAHDIGCEARACSRVRIRRRKRRTHITRVPSLPGEQLTLF